MHPRSTSSRSKMCSVKLDLNSSSSRPTAHFWLQILKSDQCKRFILCRSRIITVQADEPTRKTEIKIVHAGGSISGARTAERKNHKIHLVFLVRFFFFIHFSILRASFLQISSPPFFCSPSPSYPTECRTHSSSPSAAKSAAS